MNIKDGQRVKLKHSPLIVYGTFFAILFLLSEIFHLPEFALYLLFFTTISYFVISIVFRTLPLGPALFSSYTVIKGNRVICYSAICGLIVFGMGTFYIDQFDTIKSIVSLPFGILSGFLFFKYSIGEL